MLFDPVNPEFHLSEQFKQEIKQHWLEQFHGRMLLKVAIKAVRPNGEEVDVAAIGNRITIELKRP